MKPVELFDLCMDAIDRFNRGEVFADKPFVMLTLPRPGRTCGRTIRLFGKSGPTGEVSTAHRRADGGLDVVAYFPAVPIVQALGKEMGVKVRVRRSNPHKDHPHV
ncbi:hypothetical protein [Sphingobium sp. YC-XJ3]|uniref:hypothetical protein n=1 Tax=Sphingobium sp. YC-XJ3 TaxID=3024245 RepID=UPI002361089B|nr:hypothetical protein [Sphingobium sp. YC-XJ3]WDA37877.1 hypothetical protein PO876_06760 [Sphingobium sp. YC-XJ3]